MRAHGRRRRRTAALCGTAIAMFALLTPGAKAEWDSNPLTGVVTAQHHLCGQNDLPEGAIQGHVPKADQESGRAEQGYNCGLALVGHTQLSFDGRPNLNANMAAAGRCAYVTGPGGGAAGPLSPPNPPPGAGVAVVSVPPSGRPHHVANLRRPGGLAAGEAIHAVTTPEGRSILVVGQYGNDAVSGHKPMDVYDVSDPDCAKFRHIPNPDFPDDPTKATFYWPANIHNLTISADGRYVFATLPLQAADISALWDDDPKTGVKYLGNIQDAMDGPPVATGPMADLDDNLPPEAHSHTHPLNASHEAWPSPDGSILYIGGVTPMFEYFTILDVSRWLQRNADGSPQDRPREISQQSGRGHSVRTATIGGVPYVVHSEESVFGAAYGCVPETANPFAGPAQPWLTNIADPAEPVLVSQFGLEINDPAHCLEQIQAGENDSVHYHDVDDPSDTTFVMASMWHAGLRVFDVRDPRTPTEVGYFNPGDIDPSSNTTLDQAWGHIHYDAAQGHIWFATANGGFWVVRIEDQVRRYLELDAKQRRHELRRVDAVTDDPGRPGTVGVALTPPTGRIRLTPPC